jgi:hypothetical protein
VQLLTILERVDPKTVGVEQLLAAIGTASTASATSVQAAPPSATAFCLDGESQPTKRVLQPAR